MLVFISWTWFRSGKHESTFTPRLHLLCFHFLYVTFWNEMENAIREVHHFPHLQSPSPTLTVAHTNSSREWNPLIPTLPYILQEQSHLHFILSLTFTAPELILSATILVTWRKHQRQSLFCVNYIICILASVFILVWFEEVVSCVTIICIPASVFILVWFEEVVSCV